MYQNFMRKNKMKLLSIFKNNDIKQPVLQWSSCKQPKTLSFRTGNDMFKTTNSVYYDPLAGDTNSSSQSQSQSTSSNEVGGGPDELNVERIIREARSERLFFEPGKEDTRSILKVGAKKEEQEKEGSSYALLLKESVVMAMESEDPYLDFKNSMREMVETHGLRDWEALEELLGLYLKMNGKMNHGYIIRAFVDVLIGLCFSSSSSSSRCCSCCCSCSSEHDYTTFISASSSFSSRSSSSSSLSSAPKRDNGGKSVSKGRCIAPDR